MKLPRKKWLGISDERRCIRLRCQHRPTAGLRVGIKIWAGFLGILRTNCYAQNRSWGKAKALKKEAHDLARKAKT